jgi:hypothetical protein
MALNCGGVLVDNGWLRLLGGGYHRLPDPAALNGLGEPTGVSSPPPSLKVAYDVLGGQFAVDGGGLGTAPGPLCYFGPDTLNWVGLGTGFGAFVAWACSGHLDSFYRDLRWPGWEQEVGAVGLDQGLSFYPPLFSREAKDRAALSRQGVPMTSWPVSTTRCQNNSGLPPTAPTSGCARLNDQAPSRGRRPPLHGVRPVTFAEQRRDERTGEIKRSFGAPAGRSTHVWVWVSRRAPRRALCALA